jgi:hypothetical protein
MRKNYYARHDPSLPKTYTKWTNRARKLTSGLLSSVIRKGGNFNEPDKNGRIPLLCLAELASPRRNLLNVGTFAELALGTSAKRVPLDWNLTDAQGNTVLHLLYTRATMPSDADRREKHPRRGTSVQEFARTLCANTDATKALLSEVDLMAVNNSGESIISLIADHCLHPRSRRWDSDRFAPRFHGAQYGLMGPVMAPERFPNCLYTYEKLHAAWVGIRAPLVKSVFQNLFRAIQLLRLVLGFPHSYLLVLLSAVCCLLSAALHLVRRQLEVHLIPDLANIVSGYLLGAPSAGGKLTTEEKTALFGFSEDEQRQAQQRYIARAEAVHRWDVYHIAPGAPPPSPFDEHAYHSSADEGRCCSRHRGGGGQAAEGEGEDYAAANVVHVPAGFAGAALPILDPGIAAMEIDD